MRPGEMGDLPPPLATVRMPSSQGGDPGKFVQVSSPERIPDAELGLVMDLIGEMSQRQKFMRVEAAYRYTITFDPKADSRSIDIGLLEREVWFTLDGGEQRSVRVKGMVSGVVWLDDNQNQITMPDSKQSEGYTKSFKLVTGRTRPRSAAGREGNEAELPQGEPGEGSESPRGGSRFLQAQRSRSEHEGEHQHPPGDLERGSRPGSEGTEGPANPDPHQGADHPELIDLRGKRDVTEPVPAARRVHPIRSAGFAISPRFAPPDIRLRWTASVPRADFNIYDLGKQEGLMLPITSETTPPDRPMLHPSLWSLHPGGFRRWARRPGLWRRRAPPTEPSDKEPNFDGQPLFATWPGAGKQKPDAAIILTGQTFGLLQPCGCSRPQKGGLERRMQLVRKLKEKGWPVAGVDLGDIVPDKRPTSHFTSSTRFFATRPR